MLPFCSAPSAQAQAVQCASGRQSLRPHRRILRALDRDGHPDSCPTSLGLMSERLSGAARGHGCSGEVPFPQEQHRGPPFPGRADRAPGRAPPGVRTFTLRRPRGRALGGGGRLPGLRAGEAWPPGLGRRAAALGGRPPSSRLELARPGSQSPASRPPPLGRAALASSAPPARPTRARGARPGLLLPTPVIRTAGGSRGLAPSSKPLPPSPPPRLGSSSRAGAGRVAWGWRGTWGRGRGRSGASGPRAAGRWAPGAASPGRRLLAPGGRWRRRHFRVALLHVDLGNATGRGRAGPRGLGVSASLVAVATGGARRERQARGWVFLRSARVGCSGLAQPGLGGRWGPHRRAVGSRGRI